MNKSNATNENKYIENLVKLMANGNFEKLITEGKKYILEFPDQPFFHIGVALAYSETGKTDKAISFLKESENKFHDNFEFLYQMGKLYEEKSEFSKSIEYLNKSLNVTPDENKRARAECYNDIGVNLIYQDKKEEAIDIWKKGLEIDPANSNIKRNLKESERNDFSDDDLEFSDEVYDDFTFYQLNKFFTQKNKTKFSSEKEEKNVRGNIENAFLLEVVPKIIELESMSEDERIEFYNEIEIDFKKTYNENEMPVFHKEVTGHLQNVFPYLPDDGIILIMLVMPALEYSGITEEKFNSFITQSETPNAKETTLLKWAYDVGTKVMSFDKAKGEKKKEQALDEIVKVLNLKLDENDSEIVLDHIFDRINNAEDNFL